MKYGFNGFLASFLALACVASASAAPAADEGPFKFFSELATGYSKNDKNVDTNDFSGYLYLVPSYKLNDTYSTAFEFGTAIAYVEGGVSNFGLSHDLARVVLSQKAGKLGAFDVTVAYRLQLPTNAKLQQGGGLGLASVRPALKAEFGALTLVLRDAVLVNLTDLSYQKRVPRGAATGVTLFANTVEVLPAFDIGGGLSFSPQMVFTTSVTGATPVAGSKSATANKFEYEIELGYELPKNSILDEAAFALYHKTAVGSETEEFKLATKKGLDYIVYLRKTF